MKLLLDNCVPKRAKRLFVGHECVHVSELGLSALSNGALLRETARLGFAVLVTVDQKLRDEQHLERLPVTVLEVDTRDARFAALEQMAEHFPAAVDATQRYRFVSVSAAGTLTCLAPLDPS